MSKCLCILVLGTILALSIGTSQAFDLGTSLSEGLGGSIRLSNQSPSEIMTAPTGDLQDGVPAFECWYRRQWAMKEFDQYYVATSFRRGGLVLGLGLGQFGSGELYRELTGRVVAAYVRGALSVGASWSGLMVDFGREYDRLSTATLGLSASLKMKGTRLALVGDNLTSPSLTDHSPDLLPTYSVYAEWTGARPYRFVGRMTIGSEHSPQFGVGQVISVAPRAELFWGVSTEPTKYGGGLVVKLLGKKLSYATSYHPSLGMSHSVALTIGFASASIVP